MRVRLTCEIRNADQFEETFELAQPGKDFEVYLKNYWKRSTEPNPS